MQHKKWFDFRATLAAKEQNRSTSICNLLFLNWVFFHFSARLWTEETKWELMFDATRIISAFFFFFSSSTPVSSAKHYCNQSSGQRRESDVRSAAACVTSLNCPTYICRPKQSREVNSSSLISHSVHLRFRPRRGGPAWLVSSTRLNIHRLSAAIVESA